MRSKESSNYDFISSKELEGRNLDDKIKSISPDKQEEGKGIRAQRSRLVNGI